MTRIDPFSELHRRGNHSIEWRFVATLPVLLPDADHKRELQLIGATCEAVESSSVVEKLIKAVDASLLGRVTHQISTAAILLTTTTKKDFEVVRALVRTVLADVDPDDFHAEIKAATETKMAAHKVST